MEPQINDFKKAWCTAKECLPLSELIKNELSSNDNFSPECFKLKRKALDVFEVKAYYRVNNELCSAVAYIELTGKLISIKYSRRVGAAKAMSIIR